MFHSYAQIENPETIESENKLLRPNYQDSPTNFGTLTFTHKKSKVDLRSHNVQQCSREDSALDSDSCGRTSSVGGVARK